MATQNYGKASVSKPNVYFGQRDAKNFKLPPDSVCIVPFDERWNDFGHKTKVELLFNLIPGMEPIEMIGFLGVESSSKALSGRGLLQSLQKNQWTALDTIESELKFFTMLSDLAHYRRLVKLVAPNTAMHALLAVNDLVALDEFRASDEILKRAKKSEVFNLSFMRNADSYFALKNAGPILRGLAEERIGNVSKSIAIKFQLPGRATGHDLRFDFDFDTDMPKRICVIIGKNGVGKSQALGRIARAALDGNDCLTNGDEDGMPELNRLLAFAPTNESQSVFPSEKRRRPKIWYRRYSLNRTTQRGRGDYVSDLIIQVARSDEEIAGESRWKIFSRAISAISDFYQIHLIGTQANQKFIPMCSISAGGEQETLERFAAIDVKKEPVRLVDGKSYPLSSGEISFLKFAAQASLHIENGSLLLLDEPETHLHPNFIVRFMSLLDRMLELTGSIAIIATHSAYFVREVFQQQVTILSIQDNQVVQAQHPRLRTFGADVGAISYFVFGEDEPSLMATRLRKKLIDKHWTWPQLYERYKDELSLEMLNWLRSGVEDGAPD